MEGMMLGGWSGNSTVLTQEQAIIQQRVQQRLAEKQRAKELAAEQKDWLEESVYRTATNASASTTGSSDLSRASTESAGLVCAEIITCEWW